MNTAKLKDFVGLTEEKRRITAQLEHIQGELDALSEVLLDQFADEGVRNVNIDGHTIYLQAQLWASAVDGDYERACDALEQSGLGEFVGRRFNSNQLSAWVREHTRDEAGNYPDTLDEHLPVAFLGSIKAEKKWTVRARRSAGNGRT